MHIGTHKLSSPLILAPMAGVTDKPFRLLCKSLGAGYAVSEMTISDPRFWKTIKSVTRMDHEGEPDPIGVQIAGSDPRLLADAAIFNVDHGAQIIDINMGCPAKKVCNTWCGSALLQNERLVGEILSAVVNAVKVPVTLKIRTGWNASNINALNIASIAEDSGIAMLAIHGRTRDMMYNGSAEYETIKEVKRSVSIPIVANGDIDSPEKAKFVFEATGADAIMIGRAAQGNPWIFNQILHYLKTGEILAEPSFKDISAIMQGHLNRLYEFYGEERGVRIARKHLGWYTKNRQYSTEFRTNMNQTNIAAEQLRMSKEYFEMLDSQYFLSSDGQNHKILP